MVSPVQALCGANDNNNYNSVDNCSIEYVDISADEYLACSNCSTSQFYSCPHYFRGLGR